MNVNKFKVLFKFKFKKTLIIPQEAILLWSWWARKIMKTRTIQQQAQHHQQTGPTLTIVINIEQTVIATISKLLIRWKRCWLTTTWVPVGRGRKGNTYDGLGVFDAQPCPSRKRQGERGTLTMVLVCLTRSPVPAGRGRKGNTYDGLGVFDAQPCPSREREKGEHLWWSWCVWCTALFQQEGRGRKGNTYDGLGVFDAQPCPSRKGEDERGTLTMVLVCLMHSPVPAGRDREKGEHLRWSWCVWCTALSGCAERRTDMACWRTPATPQSPFCNTQEKMLYFGGKKETNSPSQTKNNNPLLSCTTKKGVTLSWFMLKTVELPSVKTSGNMPSTMDDVIMWSLEDPI